MSIFPQNVEKQRRRCNLHALITMSLILALVCFFFVDGLYAQTPQSIMLQRDIQKLQDRQPQPQWAPAKEEPAQKIKQRRRAVRCRPSPPTRVREALRPIQPRISLSALKKNLSQTRNQLGVNEADITLNQLQIKEFEDKKSALERAAASPGADKKAVKKGLEAYSQAIEDRRRKLSDLEKATTALKKKIEALNEQIKSRESR